MNRRVPEVIYTSQSELRSLRSLARNIWRDLKASRELAWRLMVRDISAQYRQSLLGVLWVFIPPFATALIFILLNGRKIINIEETPIPYPVFAVVGTLLWQTFVYSFHAPLRVVSASKAMLTRINFPREALVLSGMGQALFDAALKVAILVPVLIIFKIPMTWGVPCALMAVIILVLLGITLGLMITPLGLLYTDIAQGLSIMTTIWFFLTPVVYPPPARFPFSLLATVNPVSPVLAGARDLATTGVLHNPTLFCGVTLLMLLLYMLALICYRLAMPIVVERMSA